MILPVGRYESWAQWLSVVNIDSSESWGTAEHRYATPINLAAVVTLHLHTITTAIRMQRLALLVAAADFEVGGRLDEADFVAVVGHELVHPIS